MRKFLAWLVLAALATPAIGQLNPLLLRGKKKAMGTKVLQIRPASMTMFDGEAVSSFTDDAGRAFQAVGAGPLFTFSGGEAVLRFDASTDAIKTSSTFDLSAANKVDVFVRFKAISNPGSANIVYEHGTALSSDVPSIFGFTDASGHSVTGHYDSGGDANYWTTSETFGTTQTLHTKSDTTQAAANDTVIRVDDVLTGGTHSAVVESTGNFGNKTLYIGGRAGTSLLNSHIDLYEMRVYVGGLTSGEATAIVAEMNTPIVRSKLLICVGDSLFTTYAGTTSSPKEFAALLGTSWRVVNNAIPGQQASAVNTNFASQVTAYLGGSETFKLVVMRGGINDIAIGGKTAAQVMTILQTFATNVHGAGASAGVCDMTGIGATEEAAFPGLNATRNSFNTLLAASNAWADYYVPITVLKPELDDGNDLTYFTSDMIHMTTLGRQREAAALYTALIPTITTASIPTVVPGLATSHALAASGGLAPQTWTKVSGTSSVSVNGSTGLETDSDLTSGSRTLAVKVTDPHGLESLPATFTWSVAVDLATFPSDDITGIGYHHYDELPLDWPSVTDTYEYEDAGMDFNERTSNPPRFWNIEYIGGLSKAQTDIFDEFWNGVRTSQTFDFTDKYGTTWTGVRVKSYSRTHQDHKSWDKQVSFVLVKYPA